LEAPWLRLLAPKSDDFYGTILLQICVYRVRSFGSGYLLKLQLEAAKRKKEMAKENGRNK
jgi:hypothetical protein